MDINNLNSTCAILFSDIYQEKNKVDNPVGFRSGADTKVLA